jgi:hypothetical protein
MITLRTQHWYRCHAKQQVDIRPNVHLVSPVAGVILGVHFPKFLSLGHGKIIKNGNLVIAGPNHFAFVGPKIAPLPITYTKSVQVTTSPHPSPEQLVEIVQ